MLRSRGTHFQIIWMFETRISRHFSFSGVSVWDLIDLGTAEGSYIHVLGTALGGLALFLLSLGMSPTVAIGASKSCPGQQQTRMNPTVAIGTVEANHVQGHSKSG